MAWKFDKPLVTLAEDHEIEDIKKVWEGESLGGITEDNNKVPQPVVWLMVLTIITAFLITAPLWGQRPTAAIYEEYINLMDTPEVQKIATDKGKMEYIVNQVKGGKWSGLQERHPVEMDDLRMIKDQVVELQNAGARMEEYTVVGNRVVLANFEGEYRADGTQKRSQPHWDRGYTIDVFYVTYFCLAVILVIKRLPPSTWQPRHDLH